MGQGVGLVGRRHDHLGEHLGKRLGHRHGDRTVHGHYPAECRHRVALVGCQVGLGDVGADRCPTRVGVLDDHGTRLLAETVHEAPGGLGVEEVQVRHGLSAVDHGGVPPPRRSRSPVPGTHLVGVLAIPEVLHPFQGQVHGWLEGIIGVLRSRIGIEPGDDRGVVGRGVGERRPGQSAAGGISQPAVGPEFLYDRPVVGRIHQHADVGVVLGRRPDHGRTSDVDQLDTRIGREWVEVPHHQVDGRDATLAEVVHVGRVRPVSQDPAVDHRVEGLHPTAQHLRGLRHLGHLGHRYAVGRQQRRRPAARDQLPPQLHQRGGEVHDPRLVVDGQQGPATCRGAHVDAPPRAPAGIDGTGTVDSPARTERMVST